MILCKCQRKSFIINLTCIMLEGQLVASLKTNTKKNLYFIAPLLSFIKCGKFRFFHIGTLWFGNHYEVQHLKTCQKKKKLFLV